MSLQAGGLNLTQVIIHFAENVGGVERQLIWVVALGRSRWRRDITRPLVGAFHLLQHFLMQFITPPPIFQVDRFAS